jgi:hypothetical protein
MAQVTMSVSDVLGAQGGSNNHNQENDGRRPNNSPRTGRGNNNGVGNQDTTRLDTMRELIENGEIRGNNIINQVDDNTQVIFRRDTGPNAHPIGQRYPNPVDHYNIEFQTRGSSGKWRPRHTFHIIIDELGNIIDTFW